jgi:hypothetical protein
VERCFRRSRPERCAERVRWEHHPTRCPQDASFEEKGSFGTALVTTLSGDQLMRLYRDHGDRLFERNIRLFLGARKGGVNAGIRDTINSDSDRSNF